MIKNSISKNNPEIDNNKLIAKSNFRFCNRALMCNKKESYTLKKVLMG